MVDSNHIPDNNYTDFKRDTEIDDHLLNQDFSNPGALYSNLFANPTLSFGDPSQIPNWLNDVNSNVAEQQDASNINNNNEPQLNTVQQGQAHRSANQLGFDLTAANLSGASNGKSFPNAAAIDFPPDLVNNNVYDPILNSGGSFTNSNQTFGSHSLNPYSQLGDPQLAAMNSNQKDLPDGQQGNPYQPPYHTPPIPSTTPQPGTLNNDNILASDTKQESGPSQMQYGQQYTPQIIQPPAGSALGGGSQGSMQPHGFGNTSHGMGGRASFPNAPSGAFAGMGYGHSMMGGFQQGSHPMMGPQLSVSHMHDIDPQLRQPVPHSQVTSMNIHNLLSPPLGQYQLPSGFASAHTDASSPASSRPQSEDPRPLPPYPAPDDLEGRVAYIRAANPATIDAHLLKTVDVPEDATPAQRYRLDMVNELIESKKKERTRLKNNKAAKKSRLHKQERIDKAEKKVKELEKRIVELEDTLKAVSIQRNALFEMVRDKLGREGQSWIDQVLTEANAAMDVDAGKRDKDQGGQQVFGRQLLGGNQPATGI